MVRDSLPTVLTIAPAADAEAACAALEGYARVRAAAGLPEALDIIAGEDLDVLVVAAASGGVATLLRARELSPDLPAVLLADGPAAPVLAGALAVGNVFGCLEPPVDAAALREAVAGAARRRAADRARAEELAAAHRRLDAGAAVQDFAAAAAARVGQREIAELAALALGRLVPFDVAEVLIVPDEGEAYVHQRRQTPCDTATMDSLHDRCVAELGARVPVLDGAAREASGPAEGGPAHAVRSELHVAIPGPGERPVGMISLGAFLAGAFGHDDADLLGQLAAQLGVALRRLGGRVVDERRRMALMVESMADGVIMTDERHEVFLINPAARRMLGLPRDVAVTAKYLKERLGFYPFDLVARANAAREELAIGGRTLHSSVSPVLDGGGRLVGVVVVLRDITESKELEQRKEEFVSIVSHELRTPLTSIAGALDIVLKSYGGGLSDKQRTYLSMARDSCSKLHLLVNDLLDVARLERGKLPLQLAPTSLDELARDCVDAFRASADTKRLQVRFRVDRDPGNVRIVGDADRLTQVLNNLLSNAIKFTPDGGRIEVNVFGPGVASSHVGVSVWNNGESIPEEDRERVFDKFEQVNASMTRRVGGTGLGLAISRAIIEGHGGKIWVENAPVGTKFVFTLPAAPEESVVEPAPELAVTDAELVGPTGRKVLVIDDDRYAAYLLKGALMAAGQRVQVVHDVDDALAWAREHKPDLVTLDPRMRGVDGAALVELLRHDPDTRRAGVVLVSADVGAALVAGADACFAKPVELEPFRQACLRLLAEKARESQVKVLVVDDDAGIRMICREVLERAGYVVRAAVDGKAALEEHKRFRPDLVLLDIMMPDLDGFQTAKRIRADRDGAMTPIIFVSARGQTADKVRAFKLGAEDYLVKPFDSMELVARVEKALARRERELGASPTTKLPGAGAIEAEIELRLAEGGDFAFCYVDLDNLKAFNDTYGIAKADGVIRQTGDLMRHVVARSGTPLDFIGHIAGDDFVFVTTSERVDEMGQTICRTFDRLVPLYYEKKDRERGYIETSDRYGELRKIPLLSVSVAALTTRSGEVRFRTYAELAQAAADAKRLAKAVHGSSYVRDGMVVHPAPAKSVAQ